MSDSAREQTQLHIDTVGKFIQQVCGAAIIRKSWHDASKLESPEVEEFDKYTKLLKDLTYGSDEYKAILEEMKPTLDHHYANNRHHPEHHENGVDDMTLIDLVEILCDWKAATMRHDNGDIMKSIDINQERFNLSPQLAQILRNTITALCWEKEEQR